MRRLLAAVLLLVPILEPARLRVASSGGHCALLGTQSKLVHLTVPPECARRALERTPEVRIRKRVHVDRCAPFVLTGWLLQQRTEPDHLRVLQPRVPARVQTPTGLPFEARGPAVRQVESAAHSPVFTLCPPLLGLWWIIKLAHFSSLLRAAAVFFRLFLDCCALIESTHIRV